MFILLINLLLLCECCLFVIITWQVEGPFGRLVKATPTSTSNTSTANTTPSVNTGDALADVGVAVHSSTGLAVHPSTIGVGVNPASGVSSSARRRAITISGVANAAGVANASGASDSSYTTTWANFLGNIKEDLVEDLPGAPGAVALASASPNVNKNSVYLRSRSDKGVDKEEEFDKDSSADDPWLAGFESADSKTTFSEQSFEQNSLEVVRSPSLPKQAVLKRKSNLSDTTGQGDRSPRKGKFKQRASFPHIFSERGSRERSSLVVVCFFLSSFKFQ